MKNSGVNKRRTGAWGEERAAEYLKKQGVEIIAKNIHTPYGEIDLIGKDSSQLVFVEVKTLRSRIFGDPEVSVNAKKQSHMINSALHYLQQNDLLEASWRIDVVALNASQKNNQEFRWFKNAVTG